ncbi:MAG: tRNA methyltransferase [delta proteobacterium ML8_F1]|nr:MAG: tRNA methyltransferase [delta proteobacterium ML8_F1]
MAVEIVLFEPEIPPNTGNIARTCALTGTRLHLIKPLGFDIDDRTLKRAGLDYWHFLDLEVHESLEDFLRTQGGKRIFLSTTKGDLRHSDCDFTGDVMIVFGKETSGLPSSLHEKYAGSRFRIPMGGHPDLRSLNLSNAVAIVLYEALRQQEYKSLV